MNISALSTNLSQIKVAQESTISVLKMAMDTSKIQATDLTQLLQTNTKIMEQSINPNVGTNIDIKL